MSDGESVMESFYDEMQRRRGYGLRMDGHYCLACGEPLFGPEFLHTPPDPPSTIDTVRFASSSWNP